MHAHFLSSDPLLPFKQRAQFLGLNNSPHPLTFLSCQLHSQLELMGANSHSSPLNFTPLSKTVCAQTRYTVIYVAGGRLTKPVWWSQVLHLTFIFVWLADETQWSGGVSVP